MKKKELDLKSTKELPDELQDLHQEMQGNQERAMIVILKNGYLPNYETFIKFVKMTFKYHPKLKN